MPEGLSLHSHSLWFFLLLTPIAAASLPSLAYCLLEFSLWLHGLFAGGAAAWHVPAQNFWDGLFAARYSTLQWIRHWNSLATLAATGLFASTLIRRSWRRWSGLALIPYALLLCADFTVRWQHVRLP